MKLILRGLCLSNCANWWSWSRGQVVRRAPGRQPGRCHGHAWLLKSDSPQARFGSVFIFRSVVKCNDTGKSDIDVLIVGEVTQMDLFEFANRLQNELGRRVQFIVYEPADWRELVTNDQVVDGVNQDGRREVAAIRSVFSCRGSSVPERLPLTLSEELGADPTKQQVWQAFQARARITEATFAQTVRELRSLLWAWLEQASTADART